MSNPIQAVTERIAGALSAQAQVAAAAKAAADAAHAENTAPPPAQTQGP